MSQTLQVLVLKSALSNFSEVLDVAFKHLISCSTCTCLQVMDLKTTTSTSNCACYNKTVCTVLFSSRW